MELQVLSHLSTKPVILAKSSPLTVKAVGQYLGKRAVLLTIVLRVAGIFNSEVIAPSYQYGQSGSCPIYLQNDGRVNLGGVSYTVQRGGAGC
jgi:hypothetical protein